MRYLLFYEPKDEYGWASNFYITRPLTIDGEIWQTTEQYFQAMKFRGKTATPKSIEYSNIIKTADSPMKVKALGTQKKHMYGGKWKINKKTDDRILNDIIGEYSDIEMRKDWDSVRISVMTKALLHKFRQKDLREKIIAIPDDAMLVEHTTRDNVWADGGDGGTGKNGSNYLGKILTVIHHVLKYGDCSHMDNELKNAVKIKKGKKKPVKGLKILSWNINGIRSNVLGSGKLKVCGKEAPIDPFSNLGAVITEYDPDIICMQETRCNETISGCIKISGYYQYWNCSKGTGARSGDRYSGVTLWSKKEPISVKYSLPELEDEEGRIILAEYENFLLLTTYVPNAGTNFEYRVTKWDPKILKFLQKNKGKKIIWCGDLNVARFPIDIFWGDPNSSSYDKSALLGTGTSAKAGYTKEERIGMEKFLEAGYIDVFRYLYPDEKNAYTWWNPRIPMFRMANKGWRIDYFIVSQNMADCIEDMKILTDIGMLTKPYASDHAGIFLTIKC